MKFVFSLFALYFYLINIGFSQDLSPLFQQLNPSVVTIQTTEFKISKDEINQSSALGSGVIIDKSGLILTAAHVIETANIIAVKLHDDQIVEAEIIKSVPNADIALLRLKEVPKGLVVAEIGSSDDLNIGNQVMVIGAPFGIEHSLSSGYVSGKMERGLLVDGTMAKFIQTDASINHGNSGGPMFDVNGKLVGIVSFILSEGGGFDGIGFAVAINTATDLLLKDDSHFWIGFDGVFLDENLSSILNVPQKTGVLVQRVTKGSFADQLGLNPGFFQSEILGRKLWLGGDIILSILGTTCDSPHNLQSIKSTIQHLTADDEVQMEVLRHGKVITLDRLMGH